MMSVKDKFQLVEVPEDKNLQIVQKFYYQNKYWVFIMGIITHFIMIYNNQFIIMGILTCL